MNNMKHRGHRAHPPVAFQRNLHNSQSYHPGWNSRIESLSEVSQSKVAGNPVHKPKFRCILDLTQTPALSTKATNDSLLDIESAEVAGRVTHKVVDGVDERTDRSWGPMGTQVGGTVIPGSKVTNRIHSPCTQIVFPASS